MEVMALPSKELLQFYDEVDEWVAVRYPDEKTPRIAFKEDTPIAVLDLFDKIKNKIGFDYV